MRALFLCLAFAAFTCAAFAQGAAENGSAPNSSAGTPPAPDNNSTSDLAKFKNTDCPTMEQSVRKALNAGLSSPNAIAAQQEAAQGDQACATGDSRTARDYYRKALDLLGSS